MRPSWARPNPAGAANQSGGDVAPVVPRGAINTGTGEYYPPAAGGVIDPKTGTSYQDVGGGFVGRGARIIVTRNARDFSRASLPVLTPQEFLVQFDAAQE